MDELQADLDSLDFAATDLDDGEFAYPDTDQLPDEADLLYDPDADTGEGEPVWDEPGGQRAIEEELALHTVAQQQLQFMIASSMIANDSTKEEIATMFVDVTNSWESFPDVMTQLRTLAPTYFEEQIDITLGDAQLLEQISEQLNALLNSS